MGGGNSFFFKVTSAEVCGFFEVSKSKRKVKKTLQENNLLSCTYLYGLVKFLKISEGSVYIRPNPYKTLTQTAPVSVFSKDKISTPYLAWESNLFQANVPFLYPMITLEN